MGKKNVHRLDQHVRFNQPTLEPRNQNQAKFIDAVHDNAIIMAKGEAGTGKTFLASFLAAQALEDGDIDRIIICRPIVQAAGEDLGFLPGTLNDKAEPYLRPMFDAFHQYWVHRNGHVEMLLRSGKIEIAPLAFMRGRSFNRCWILCDEAQNMNHDMMKMLLTRLAEESKMIITGDPNQRDYKDARGFEHAEACLSGTPNIAFINFGKDDVVRHETVKEILKRWKD